jgi:hypothetical protein
VVETQNARLRKEALERERGGEGTLDPAQKFHACPSFIRIRTRRLTISGGVTFAMTLKWRLMGPLVPYDFDAVLAKYGV